MKIPWSGPANNIKLIYGSFYSDYLHCRFLTGVQMRLYKKRKGEEIEPVSTNEREQAALYARFEAIFQATKDRLHHFTIKLTRNDTATQDIIQEVYTRLWEKLSVLNTDDDVLPLLLTYARNCFIDALRKKERDDRFLYQLTDDLSEATPATAEASLDLKDRQQQLQQSLDRLPAKRREIFSLVKEKGLSHKQVAEQLGIAPATVEKQVGLSLQFLRKEMGA